MATTKPTSELPPLLTRAEVGTLPTGILDCPGGKFDSLRKLGLAALTELVNRKQPPCGRVILGELLLERARSAADFREAARRLVAGHDSNEVTGNCDVFELGIGIPADLRRAAQCYYRLGRWLELAVLVAGGSGVPRDPDLAQAIFEFASRGNDDCSVQRARDIIRATPPTEGYRWCDDAACTTLDTNVCQASKNLRERWLSAEKREAIIARFDEPTKRRLDALWPTLADYVDADSRCVYQQYIEGTIRNAMALTRQAEIHQSFERVLAQIAEGRLPAAGARELLDAEHELLAAQQLQLATDWGDPASKRDRRALCRKAYLAFDRYAGSWIRFSTSSGLPPATSSRDLRLLLLRERLKMLSEAGP